MERLDHLKLIVADLDGTLLDERKHLDPDMSALLPVMSEQGIFFTFGSGRNMHIMQEFVSQLHIQIPYITNNGANMYEGNRCIYECRITPFDLQPSLTLLKEAEIPFLAYSNSAVYPMGSHPVLTAFMKRLVGKSEIVETGSIQEIVKHPIFKVVILQENEQRMMDLMDRINGSCKEAHCVRSEGEIYTLTHIHATKGNTLDKLMEILKITPKQVLVFGDNYNDVSMFKAAGTSVAMGNALKEIQDQATFVTKTNEEHGVSWFIKQYIVKHSSER